MTDPSDSATRATATTPQELRALADRIESRTCTGDADVEVTWKVRNGT